MKCGTRSICAATEEWLGSSRKSASLGAMARCGMRFCARGTASVMPQQPPDGRNFAGNRLPAEVKEGVQALATFIPANRQTARPRSIRLICRPEDQHNEN
jgi:hypothetical protein